MEEFYKKKTIRDFLSLFSQNKWKNLCILCMEYGIMTLKKNYQISSLSMDDIEQFIEDMKEEENKNNKKNLKQKYNNSIKSNTNINNTNNTNNNKVANTPSYNPSFSVSSSRPSSEWRKGESKTIFDYENNYTNTINDISMNKKSKEKMLDDILYPKNKHIVNYTKQHRIIGDKKMDKNFAVKNNNKITNSKYRPLSKDMRKDNSYLVDKHIPHSPGIYYYNKQGLPYSLSY